MHLHKRPCCGRGGPGAPREDRHRGRLRKFRLRKLLAALLRRPLPGPRLTAPERGAKPRLLMPIEGEGLKGVRQSGSRPGLVDLGGLTVELDALSWAQGALG